METVKICILGVNMSASENSAIAPYTLVGPFDSPDVYILGDHVTQEITAMVNEAKVKRGARVIRVTEDDDVAAIVEAQLHSAKQAVKICERAIKRTAATWAIAATCVIVALVVAAAAWRHLSTAEDSAVVVAPPAGTPVEYIYRADLSGRVYHLPTCASAKDIKDRATGTDRAALERDGLRPCKRCLALIDYQPQK